MNKKKFSPKDNDLMQIIERYEAMKKDNKILYLDADQYADIVDYYIAEGRINEAYETIESGLNIHPDSTILLIMLASLYLDEERLVDARRIVDSIKTDQSVDTQMLLIELLLGEGNIDEAQNLIDNLDIDDDDTFTMLDVAYLCIDYDISEGATKWLKKILEIDPTNEEALSTIGEFYCSQEEYEEAINIYNTLIDIRPYSSEYWTKLAGIYFNLSIHDKAIEAADFAIVSNENNGEAHSIKAHSYHQLGNYETAIEEYEIAGKLNSITPELAFLLIAFCYMRLDNWHKAYEQLGKGINIIDKESPIMIDLILHAIRCLYNMDRREEAHNYCKNALEQFPNNVDILLWDGRIYYEEENTEEAMNQWVLALAAAPYSETWSSIGTTLLNNLDFESAEKFFLTAEEMEPGNEEVRRNLAITYLGLRDYEKFLPYKKDFITYIEASDIDSFANFSTEDGKALYQKTRQILDKLRKDDNYPFIDEP